MTKQDSVTLGQILEYSEQTFMVGEFAALLKVHPDTIRRWERKGHLNSLRHPVNNYRLFRISDLKGKLVDGENK